MGQYITISVETLSSYLSITNEGDEHHTGSYDTSLTRPNDYVGNNMDIHDYPSRAIISFIDISTAHSCNWKLDDEENWVCKFDWQSSAAQASTVPPVAPQSSDVPRSPHDAYPTLLALPSLCTTRLRRRSMGCRWKSMHALMH
ncbi:hypothetical protein Gogos_010139 [Gossypium gossypioides]|uniref:Uncharacterized protein n=1 Tax=Gossypium gossypioides TaxID=34282 RepID=A0A7J9BKB9_GOSGO|nr:hypothetical protein [Gossypium gossypioides]